MRLGTLARARGIQLLLVMIGLTLACAASAQQQSREREALRRAQQQISKLQQDNAELQRAKSDAEAKLKAAQSEASSLKGVPAKLKRSEQNLAALERDKVDLQVKLAANEEQQRASTLKYQADIGNLRNLLERTQAAGAQAKHDGEQERDRLSALLNVETGRVQACEAKNQQLYGVTVDLIDRYKQNRGAWEKFLLSEPFTGLKSVEVDNLLADMRDKAADAKVKLEPK